MAVTRPHKAETAELNKLTFPAIAFPKVDGVRGIKILREFTSRELKPFRNTMLTEELSNPLFHGMDGEMAVGNIQNPDKNLCRTTTSFTNSYWMHPLPREFSWNVFDLVTDETEHLPYAKRFKLLKALVETIHEKEPGKYPFLRTMPDYVVVNSLDEFTQAHTLYKSMGYEGTIYRDPAAPHKNGRSTVNQSYFMRMKDFADAEGIIEGFTEAQENTNEAVVNRLGYIERSTAKAGKVGKGMIGAVMIRNQEGETILCGPGCLTHDERVYYFHNPSEFIGRLAKYTFMPYGQYKKPRFPQYAGFRASVDTDFVEL